MYVGQKVFRHFRPGEWVCSCGEKNRAHRKECFFCSSPKEDDSEEVMLQSHGRTIRINNREYPNPRLQMLRQVEVSRDYPIQRQRLRYMPVQKVFTNLQPGDWICPMCGEKNYPKRVECFNCNNERPENLQAFPIPTSTNLKPGQWICKLCGEKNYSHREECYGCENPKIDTILESESFPGFEQGSFPVIKREMQGKLSEVVFTSKNGKVFKHLQAGDWICSNCGEKCRARRKECMFCNTPKTEDVEMPIPKGPTGGNLMLPGDWKCVSCGENNFANRAACRNCYGRRPEGIERLNPIASKNKYNWECTKCGEMNVGYAKNCITCQGPKPEVPNAPVVNEEPEWICSTCAQDNEGWRRVCRQCKQLNEHRYGKLVPVPDTVVDQTDY